jgi:hypothetical protein
MKASVFSNGPLTLGPTLIWGEVRSATSSIVLGSGGHITGNVRAGTTITNAGMIDGTKAPNSPSPTLNPSPVAPCAPYSTAAAVGAGTKYNAATGDLTITGANTVTLAAGTYCFHNISLSGQGHLDVAGPVVIRVTGAVSSTTGGFNTAGGTYYGGPPTNLRLESSYTGANGVILSGGVSAMSVFAPRTNVVLTGGAILSGAVLGKTLSASGTGTSIHQDLALATAWAQYFPSPAT